MQLNPGAQRLVERMLADSDTLRIATHHAGGATVIDCGVEAPGGLEAGRRMAEVCFAGLGDVQIAGLRRAGHDGPGVFVRTDHPVAACMASQYAGWQVTGDDYFAMASGPMRAAAGREELFKQIGRQEAPESAVGVLEASALPPESVCRDLAEKCGVPAEKLTLLVAPTNSQAGTLQVVARSVETALHKLHEIGFDIERVESGWGSAPLAPVAKDAMAAIGRTNDAILYGGHAILYVRGDDESIREIGPKAVSAASSDHGRPFAEVFASYDYDFYKIDPMLFSPARVTFANLDTGNWGHFGGFSNEVLTKSFVG